MPEYLPDWEALRATAERLVPYLRAIFGASAEDTVRSEQLGLNWDAVDANALRYARERAGELVGMKWDDTLGWVENPNPEWSITETTRARVNELTDEAVTEGWSPQRLRDALEETGLFGAARAEMIARTEVAIAENKGQLRTMGEAGFDRVYVYDGDCNECSKVDGKVASLAWAEANPLQHPNAIFAGTAVLVLGDVQVAYRARWNGPGVELVTAGGHRLPVGPNHPVLTGRGWVAAKEVLVGDDVITNRRGDHAGHASTEMDLDDAEPVIEKVFDSLAADALASRCACAPADFHGDGNFCEGDIDVVRPDRLLGDVRNTSFVKQPVEGALVWGDVEPKTFDRLRSHEFLPQRDRPASGGGVGLTSVGRIVVPPAEGNAPLPQALPDDVVASAETLGQLARGFAFRISSDEGVHVDRDGAPAPGPSQPNAHVAEDAVDDIGRDTQRKSDRDGGLPCVVTLDKIVDVREVHFLGHAFDLQVGGRAYFANSILVSNCVRAFSGAPEDEPIELHEGAKT